MRKYNSLPDAHTASKGFELAKEAFERTKLYLGGAAVVGASLLGIEVYNQATNHQPEKTVAEGFTVANPHSNVSLVIEGANEYNTAYYDRVDTKIRTRPDFKLFGHTICSMTDYDEDIELTVPVGSYYKGEGSSYKIGGYEEAMRDKDIPGTAYYEHYQEHPTDEGHFLQRDDWVAFPASALPEEKQQDGGIIGPDCGDEGFVYVAEQFVYEQTQ